MLLNLLHLIVRAKKWRLACVLVALLWAGCGSSDSSQLTKAEFIKQANAVCKKGEAKRQASFTAKMRPGVLKKGNAGREELILTAVLPPIVQMTDELDELEPPSSEAANADALVRSLEQEINTIEANPMGVYSGELGKFEGANEWASVAGLAVCSEV
jgi:hypothetical protein